MTTSDIALSCASQRTDSLEALLPAERERLLLGLAGELHRNGRPVCPALA